MVIMNGGDLFVFVVIVFVLCLSNCVNFCCILYRYLKSTVIMTIYLFIVTIIGTFVFFSSAIVLMTAFGVV